MEIIIKERMGERGREKSQQQNKEQRRAMEGVKKWIIIQLFLTDAAYGDNMMCGWRELTQHMRTHADCICLCEYICSGMKRTLWIVCA